jgi:hypothetical protein
MKVQKMIPVLAVAALLALPAAAVAETCWNRCSIAATHEMNNNGLSLEEATLWHSGCVAGCEMQ